MKWTPVHANVIVIYIVIAGVKVGEDVYAWLIVFILPVNSALNPLLYTLTTRLYKRKLISSFCSYLRGGKSLEKSSSNTLARPIHICQRSAYPNIEMRSCSKFCMDDQIRIDNDSSPGVKVFLLRPFLLCMEHVSIHKLYSYS